MLCMLAVSRTQENKQIWFIKLQLKQNLICDNKHNLYSPPPDKINVRLIASVVSESDGHHVQNC